MTNTYIAKAAITIKAPPARVWDALTQPDLIKQYLSGKLLVSTYWSALSGLPDLPESYQTVRYELAAEGGGTRLTIVQDNNASPEDANHSAQNWSRVLDGMKKLLEG